MSSNIKIVPVILSGGAGTRLWPLSRELYPKQLLPLVGERTMLQETVLRLEGLADLGAPLVVCNDAHRFMVAEQLREVEQAAETVILEPVGRNTAPAVAVAALQAMADGSDPLLLVLAADHVIRDAAALCAAVTAGVDSVQGGALLTFGIVPTSPETGYGYIRKEKSSDSRPLLPVENIFDVQEFVEKPDLVTAEKYLASGDYYWNSGMFFFKASVYLAELEKSAPEMLAACRKA
jgi:mannose-1-phosphate guanylyltransferase/mannose-6-phosphate isomerase